MDGERWSSFRASMVERQLRARGIGDPGVLAAMRKVERHLFVPERYRESSYEDEPLPIGEGQTISQPYMVALMTEALGPVAGRKVLEVGTGSGYQAAVLCEMGAEVFTIERNPALAERALALLAGLGYEKIRVVVGDGTLGLPEEAPFGGIIVTAGGPAMPESLKAQLDPGGGVMVIPVGDRGIQELTKLTRHGDSFDVDYLGGCRFVPLVGCEGWNG